MQYCKRVIIICCSLLIPAIALSQASSPPEDITGLWTGYMYNDSTQLNYRYEIAISEKKGKLYGFSHTYFILGNKEYHGVKKLKITRKGNQVITQDQELIANNYPVKPPKGVYVLNVLNFEIKNSIMVLSGLFNTNRTREYAPVTGYIHVERKSNFRQSALIPHLQELGLAAELSFVQEEKTKETAAAVTKTDNEQTVAKTTVKEKATPGNETKPAEAKKEETAAIQPVTKKQTPKAVAKNQQDNKTTEKNDTAVKSMPATAEIITKNEPVKQKPVANAAVDLVSRTIETIQSVNYASDSLVLTLYDNGEVDGDTVSVLMNGEVIMPKVGLSTNAVTKTIYTKDLPDSIQIVMYAETLGTLPPNTGLLIVNDGADRYEIRFSGDLKKNAAIVFRRKQN